MKNTNLEQLKRYFLSFCSKNIEDLKDIFSDNVELKDWNNEFFGKEEVLKEVKSIFNSFNSIQLKVISVYEFVDALSYKDGEHFLSYINHIVTPSDNKFACQIEISFDGGEPLRVIDLIEFDDSGNIKNLTAYKR